MTHYHDITLNEINYICNKLFAHDDQSKIKQYSVSEYARQQIMQCIVHKNFKKSTYDFSTGSCSGNKEHDKLLHTKTEDEWQQPDPYIQRRMGAKLYLHVNTYDVCFPQYGHAYRRNR